MADAFDQSGPRADAIGRWNLAFAKAAPSLVYALRLWVAVCLALFVAFWLELDNPFWAGTSAALVCQPQLGASLRKGWFRMIGTVVGATMIVVLTACFPQDRIAFLVLLAFWCSLCAFAATVLRNFASYSAALAGYTAAIIAADNLGATGGASSDVFLLAVTRASEICIGIACAGIVLAGTDLGGAQRRLAESFATLAAEIMGRFSRMLALAETQLPDTKAERREFVRRVIALDPMIDQALGNPATCATTRQGCKQRCMACSGRWTAGAELRHISVVCPRPRGGRGHTSSCEASRPSFDRYRRQARRCSGSLILWPCTAFAKRRCGH
jgi:hypothetical protein